MTDNSKSRLLVITELFLPTKGGTAVWFDECYSRMGNKELHIVTANVEGGTEYDKTHNNTVHRVTLNRYKWLRPESIIMYIKLFFVSFNIILFNKIDAIHAGKALPEGLVGFMVAAIFRKPLVIYAHGEEITTWRQTNKFKAMKFVYHHADKIIANSRFTKNELNKIGIKSDKIVVISPGVDVERFKPMDDVEDLLKSINITKKQKVILSVGRFSRRKGFDQIIKSLSSLRANHIDVHYVIIGIGEDKEYLEQLAISESVQNYVHMLGHISMKDLPRWYNAADVFAMPNREINGDTEGFGMVFLEASACGKPVIAGIAGGTADAVVHNETGLRIDAQSASNVSNALLTLLTDKKLSDRLGANGLKRTINGYSWDLIVSRILNSI